MHKAARPDAAPNCSLPITFGSQTPQFLEAKNQKLLDAGIIHKSISPWESPIVVVKKHIHKGWPQQFCLCINYRKLNSLLLAVTAATGTKKGTPALMPLPKIDEVFALLKRVKYFTTLVLCSGHYHIKMGEESIPPKCFHYSIWQIWISKTSLLLISRPRLLHFSYLWPFQNGQDV